MMSSCLESVSPSAWSTSWRHYRWSSWIFSSTFCLNSRGILSCRRDARLSWSQTCSVRTLRPFQLLIIPRSVANQDKDSNYKVKPVVLGLRLVYCLIWSTFCQGGRRRSALGANSTRRGTSASWRPARTRRSGTCCRWSRSHPSERLPSAWCAAAERWHSTFRQDVYTDQRWYRWTRVTTTLLKKQHCRLDY